MKKTLLFNNLILLMILLFPSFVEARSIFVNGVDITGAVEQTLREVTVYIDKNGDVLITAPQYRVLAKESVKPLGEKPERRRLPKHRSPEKMSVSGKVPEDSPIREQDLMSSKSNTNGEAKVQAPSRALVEDPANQ